MAAAENGALPTGRGDGLEIGRLQSGHCDEEWRFCVPRAPEVSRDAAELFGQLTDGRPFVGRMTAVNIR